MEVRRIFDIIPYRRQRFGDDGPAVFRVRRDNVWQPYTLDSYSRDVRDLACALLHLGLSKGDRVALISGNRPEWNVTDMAVMRAGGITVPVYSTINEEDYRHILTHSGAQFVFLEDRRIWRKIASIVPDIPAIRAVYSFVPCDGCLSFDALLETGRVCGDDAQLAARETEVSDGDVACLMYTSGTTGVPKGVLQTHRGIMLNINGIKDIPDASCRTAFSFLPLCHAYEKMMVYFYQFMGMETYYAQSLGTIADNMKEIRPHIMTTVPRILERIQTKILSTGQSLHGLQKVLFDMAHRWALQYQIEGMGPLLRLRLALADRLVYRRWREAVGADRFQIVVSGGSALKPSQAAFFSAMGMPVFEGYGLTETSPVISVHNNLPHGRMVGTVGKPLAGVEVRVADDGEIICRGDNVMKGYYLNDELTRAYIDADGWFHTGDLGRITPYGHLVITGRKKSLFKTSSGKYVNPDVLEMKCMESPFIEQMVVFGENQKFPGALIQPDFGRLRRWCSAEGLPEEPAAMVAQPEVRKLYQKELERFNAGFSEYERIKKFALVSDEWNQANGLLTPTLKVKHKAVEDRYADEIAALFT